MRDEDAAAVAKALGHPVRIEILRLVPAGREASPSELSRESGHPLGNVSYHVRILFEAGILRLAEKVPRGGTMEHRYELSAPRAGAALAVAGLLASL